jgi:hypothetical protein
LSRVPNASNPSVTQRRSASTEISVYSTLQPPFGGRPSIGSSFISNAISRSSGPRKPNFLSQRRLLTRTRLAPERDRASDDHLPQISIGPTKGLSVQPSGSTATNPFTSTPVLFPLSLTPNSTCWGSDRYASTRYPPPPDGQSWNDASANHSFSPGGPKPCQNQRISAETSTPHRVSIGTRR